MSFTIENLILRPVREPKDLPLLQRIYAASRDYETPYFGFSETELEEFLASQFQMQHRQYMNVPDTAFYVIEDRNGIPMGRFYVKEMPYAEIRIMDIALLPEYRQQGIGRALFRKTIDRAQKEGKRVSIHVEKMNPAHIFYEKLGFGYVSVDGIYDLMVWPPAEAGIAKEAQDLAKANTPPWAASPL